MREAIPGPGRVGVIEAVALVAQIKEILCMTTPLRLLGRDSSETTLSCVPSHSFGFGGISSSVVFRREPQCPT